jgi:glycosyltransferase involved in cell wall biosynthesis
MKILIRQFLGKNMSWCVVGWGVATSLIESGHEVHLFSTDGVAHLPSHLKNNLIGFSEENNPQLVNGRLPDTNYDCQISYTCMKNFPPYLGSGSKNRFGIWCYEWAGKNVLPNGFAKHYKSCDYLCPPSNFAKQVFIDSGISEQNIKVIPHGINTEEYGRTSTIKLPTDKKFKLLANIAQNHLRKNIPGLLEAYGKAFTNKDDVCLILKAKDKPIKSPFEISLKNCLSDFNIKYPNHAEVKVFSDFVDDISSLYRSVDAVYSLSHCEGFYFPGLEGLAAGKLSIAPGWGGQLDFLNKTNSLLVEGKEVRADPKSMYWESKNNAIWFQPSIEDAANKLQHAYHNYEQLNYEVEKQKPIILSNYSWHSIVSQFLQLCR